MGWLATVADVAPADKAGKKRKSAGGVPDEGKMIVTFQCDGEDAPVSMTVAEFRKHCKSI